MAFTLMCRETFLDITASQIAE